MLPNSGVEDGGSGIVGVAEVNENTALEGLMDIAEPLFGMPNDDGAVVIGLLPNIGETENALLDPKAEEAIDGRGSGVVVITEVVPEAAVEETTELKLKGLGLRGAEPNGKLPMFDSSGDIISDLLAELCVHNELLFPGWANWFPDNNVDSGEVTLDLSRDATKFTLPNCGEKLNGALLLPALDLFWAANKLAPPNFGEKLKGALALPDVGALADWEEAVFVDKNGLFGLLDARTAEAVDFDVCSSPLLKVVGLELATVNTGLLVNDATCPAPLEETGGISPFNFLLCLSEIELSSETRFKILGALSGEVTGTLGSAEDLCFPTCSAGGDAIVGVGGACEWAPGAAVTGNEKPFDEASILVRFISLDNTRLEGE